MEKSKKGAWYDAVIVGAGASGLMCAWLLGRKGLRVAVLEKNSVAGKKLMATGNGRCNFTNRQMDAACYYGEENFVKAVLRQVNTETVLGLFEELGIWHRERDGYCYPYSGQAATVGKLLTKACLEQNVMIFYETRVGKVIHKNGEYTVSGKNEKDFRCRYLILACGGKAYESLGGDGSGYKLCRSLSHHITELYPGLTGLKAEGKEWRQLAGVRMQGSVTLLVGNEPLREERGEIQLVKDGVSGIPVFQLCRLAAKGLEKGNPVTLVLDFFPDMESGQLEEWLLRHGTGKLEGLINKKWIPVIQKKTEMEIPAVARLLKQYPIRISTTFGFEKAQVTAGGVRTEEVDAKTMQSNIHEHLYLLGELLDVDGICGGYNLHFAWSTAYICARAISRSVNRTTKLSKNESKEVLRR